FAAPLGQPCHVRAAADPLLPTAQPIYPESLTLRPWAKENLRDYAWTCRLLLDLPAPVVFSTRLSCEGCPCAVRPREIGESRCQRPKAPTKQCVLRTTATRRRTCCCDRMSGLRHSLRKQDRRKSTVTTRRCHPPSSGTGRTQFAN